MKRNICDKVKEMDDYEQWKRAEETIENFNKMMKLIRQYPIKPIKPVPSFLPYTSPDLFPYIVINVLS